MKKTVVMIICILTIVFCAFALADGENGEGKQEPEAVSFPGTGLHLDADGVFRLYKDGALDTQTFGIVEYNGGRFFVANGTIVNATGLKQDGEGKWYYCANGQVADYTGLALYDGAWFFVTDGILDTAKSGIVEYDGGRFMLAAGSILRNANGLIQDPVDGNWYYVAAGQVAEYTGLVEYDGAWFYVINGRLAVEYTGEVIYGGSVYHVENGYVSVPAVDGSEPPQTGSQEENESIPPQVSDPEPVPEPVPEPKPEPVPEPEPAPKQIDPLKQAFVTHCYRVVLNRDPDENEMKEFAAELTRNPGNARSFARNLVLSAAVASRNLSNEDFVTMLYLLFYNRNPDKSGLAAWVTRLNMGDPRESIVDGFITTGECIAFLSTFGL